MEYKKIYCGIDPGKSGAIAFYDGKKMEVYDYENPSKIADILAKHEPDLIYMEKVGARPGQGVVSMFSFGENYGIYKGIMAAMGFQFILISPQKWQKGLIFKTDGKDKASRSINACLRLFPDKFEILKRKKDNGRADAMMIAYVAWKAFNGDKK